MTIQQQVEDTDLKHFFICARDEDGAVHTNVPRRISYHSPDGFEFGYAGDGPSDLALNLTLHAVEQLGLQTSGHARMLSGQWIPGVVADVYLQVRKRFIEAVPQGGARIDMGDVRQFILDHVDPGEPTVLTPA